MSTNVDIEEIRRLRSVIDVLNGRVSSLYLEMRKLMESSVLLNTIADQIIDRFRHGGATLPSQCGPLETVSYMEVRGISLWPYNTGGTILFIFDLYVESPNFCGVLPSYQLSIHPFQKVVPSSD